MDNTFKRISVELPAHLIDMLDEKHEIFKRKYPAMDTKNRSLVVKSLLRYALNNPPMETIKPDTDTPAEIPQFAALVPMKPITHTPAKLDDSMEAQPLSPVAIGRMQTADIINLLQLDGIKYNDNLMLLSSMSPSQLSRKLNISIATANRIAVNFEFARRVACSHAEREKVTSPSDISSLLMPIMRNLMQEIVIVIALDTKGGVFESMTIAENAETLQQFDHQIVDARRIFTGTVNGCMFHPREIFRFLIDVAANSFVIAHNHPSGDPQPSQEDIRATKQLREAGNYVGINCLDHIIIGDGIFYSLKEEGVI